MEGFWFRGFWLWLLLTNLYNNIMKERIFGEIPGIFEGQEFDNRIELSVALVHRPLQAGISGSQNEGADSIVLSGGYIDDVDNGNEIIYTGHGGRDLSSGKQVVDQELTRQNLALTINCQQGLPVRVIRGAFHKSKFSPEKGYRYDGLYRVENYWKEKGRNGYNIWRFRLVKISKSLKQSLIQPTISIIEEEQKEYKKAIRLETIIQRIVRDTELSRTVKEMYNYECQVCRTAIQTNSGLYAESAHIKPLGAPHNGPDVIENIICLCPNHHVRFDFGGFSILDNFELIGEIGHLRVNPRHRIKMEFLRYHREHFYEDR